MEPNSLVYSIIDDKELCDSVYDTMVKHMRFNDSSSVVDTPFMNNNGKKTLEEIYEENDIYTLKRNELDFLNGQDRHSSRPDKYRFPLVFKIIYLILNNSHTEMTFINENEKPNFTLFSLSKIMKDYDVYNNIVLVGMMYHGMGYYVGLFMVKKTGEFFYALDGGSNGYDREYNFNYFKKFEPSEHDNLELRRFPNIINYLKKMDNIFELRFFRE